MLERFNLSYKAMMRYGELKDIKLYPYCGYKDTFKPYVHGVDDYYMVMYSSRELAQGEHGISSDCYVSDYDIPRNDSLLVQVIEELGAEANGDCAELKIVEIPDDVSWEISEYDGIEHIAETHRVWS